MNLSELENKLKNEITYKKAIYALFRALKDNKEIILSLNKKQLFEQSVGADGKELGFYSFSEKNKVLDREGDPFSMIDTGLFKDGMFIEFYYRHITIRSHYHVYAMLQNDSFLTKEFFGLTTEHYNELIESFVKPFLQSWIRETLSN